MQATPPKTPPSQRTQSGSYVRLDRIRQGIEPILDLVGLLADLVQRTRVGGAVCIAGTAKGTLRGQIVAGRATYLGHDRDDDDDDDDDDQITTKTTRDNNKRGRISKKTFLRVGGRGRDGRRVLFWRCGPPHPTNDRSKARYEVYHVHSESPL